MSITSTAPAATPPIPSTVASEAPPRHRIHVRMCQNNQLDPIASVLCIPVPHPMSVRDFRQYLASLLSPLPLLQPRGSEDCDLVAIERKGASRGKDTTRGKTMSIRFYMTDASMAPSLRTTSDDAVLGISEDAYVIAHRGIFVEDMHSNTREHRDHISPLQVFSERYACIVPPRPALSPTTYSPPPPPGYICHGCGQPGHLRRFCGRSKTGPLSFLSSAPTPTATHSHESDWLLLPPPSLASISPPREDPLAQVSPGLSASTPVLSDVQPMFPSSSSSSLSSSLLPAAATTTDAHVPAKTLSHCPVCLCIVQVQYEHIRSACCQRDFCRDCFIQHVFLEGTCASCLIGLDRETFLPVESPLPTKPPSVVSKLVDPVDPVPESVIALAGVCPTVAEMKTTQQMYVLACPGTSARASARAGASAPVEIRTISPSPRSPRSSVTITTTGSNIVGRTPRRRLRSRSPSIPVSRPSRRRSPSPKYDKEDVDDDTGDQDQQDDGTEQEEDRDRDHPSGDGHNNQSAYESEYTGGLGNARSHASIYEQPCNGV